MEDAWALACPCTGGKRPRSPVEKLADLQCPADEDDAHWRSSKRFFTEVISSGFSKLTFGRALQQAGNDEQLGVQLLSMTTSPKGHAASSCYVQLPGTLQLPRDDACDMDMQTSPNTRQSPGSNSNRMHRPPSLTEVFAGPAASPVCSPAAASSVNHSPIQNPIGSCSSPAAGTGNKQLPPPAWQLAAGCMAAAAAVPQSLPKVLKAAEKPPNSPSDLPSSGSNLRKVALLRSLLARTEQHLQQHQLEQQHQQLHESQQQESGNAEQEHQHVKCRLDAPSPQCEQQQQQHEFTGTTTNHNIGKHLQDMHRLHAQQGCAAAAAANTAAGALSHTYPTAKPAPSDEMDCSSSSAACSSFADSDSSEASGGRPVLPDTKNLAATSLLCTEVLPFSNNDSFSWRQQQERQFGQHCFHVSLAEQLQEQQHQNQQRQPVWEGHAQQPSGHVSVFGPLIEQLQNCPRAPSGEQLMEQQPQQILQQQQQVPQRQAKLPKALETLSRDRLEALRAKALANTSKLTDLEPEDLHSLQLSIAASKSRRGSADHTPSHLHTQTPAEARRHSSHI